MKYMFIVIMLCVFGCGEKKMPTKADASVTVLDASVEVFDSGATETEENNLSMYGDYIDECSEETSENCVSDYLYGVICE